MKRDLDLIRDILLKTEGQTNENYLPVSEFVTDEYNADDVSRHIKLLLDADYIEAGYFKYSPLDYPDFRVKRITMQGYDYLESVRDEAVWRETKKRIASTVISGSLDFVKSVAVSVAMAKMTGF